jgi:hypothetical protein
MSNIDPLNGGSAVLGALPAAGSSAPAKKEKPVRIAANAAPPPDTPVYQSCLIPQLSPVDYHFCILEANWLTLEQMRRKGFEETVKILDGSLGMVDGKPKGLMQWIKEKFFSSARRANFQADNWLLLDAAKKSVNMFYYSRGDQNYLAKAIGYVETALRNADTSLNFDNYRFTLKDLLSPTIHPVEAYFELKLSLFHLLSLFQPKKALALGKEIEAELQNRRLLKAQRSNPVSARGYLNRLYVLYGFAGIYNPAMDQAASLKYTKTAQDWAKQKHGNNTVGLFFDDMNKKDLKYDTLLSRTIEGRLLIKAKKYDEALELFKALFNEPEACKKFGGFLDIGLQAFFSIMLISLVTSSSLEEATQKFERAIPWEKISSPEFEDFRESLGLLIRHQNLADKISGLFEVKMVNFSEKIGNLALYLDSPGLAPKDTNPVISKLSLADYKTAREKVDLFMQLLKYSQLTFDQKAEIIKYYNQLKDAEGK